jgi:hypothetical protein
LQQAFPSTATARDFNVYAALNNRAYTNRYNNKILSSQKLQQAGNQQNKLLAAINSTANNYAPSGNSSYYQQSSTSLNQSPQKQTDLTDYEPSENFKFFFKILDLPAKFFNFVMKHSVGTLVTGILFLLFLSLFFGSHS